MTSAFAHYSRKKKNLILNDGLPKITNGELKSSTPHPQHKAPLFLPSSDEISPVENVFLSPILEHSRIKIKSNVSLKKPKRKLHVLDTISENKQVDLKNIENKAKKLIKEKKKEEAPLKSAFGSPMHASLVSPKEFKITNLLSPNKNNDSDSLFNDDGFLKKSNRKRKLKNKDVPTSKKRKLLDKYENMSSLDKGRNMLEWILSPVTVQEFFDDYWEKRPLHISRENLEFFNGICSKDDLDRAFRDSQMNLLKNVTVTAYQGGKRLTDKTPGRARPNTIWEMFENGQSIRLYNPQTFIPNVGVLAATLQEYFRCMVGVNSYLTPAGTQGFAPHYDDIEAFVLQVEGEKDWKVYPPRTLAETLPQFSSPDFDQNEIGEPMLEVTLKAGDLLYFPRGFIHQARSLEHVHSLHLTVSTYQCNTWGDFLKKVIPQALERAIVEDVTFREGLPLDFIDNMGLVSEDSEKAARASYIERCQKMFGKLLTHCAWDDAADQIGKDYIHSSFPPPNEELQDSVWRKLLKKSSPNVLVRLIAANACRLTNEDGDLVVYYSTDNSLTPREDELLGFSVSPSEAAVFQSLIETYPKYSNICHLSENDGHPRKSVKRLIINLAKRALIQAKSD